jgi:molybdopterin-guanine dinucleotide biosynthesis protein A
MGRDKALLESEGRRLVEIIFDQVLIASSRAWLIGPPERYRQTGLPVIPDHHPGGGPLGGILTALEITPAIWNLVVACDMPALTAEFLGRLFREAETAGATCLVPSSGPDRLEPLCAVYHRDCLPAIRKTFHNGIRKVTEGLAGLRIHLFPVQQVQYFQNLNTPADWADYHD